MSSIEYDIVMATDLRFPGGTTASVVEEVEAQYRAGYRTALLHLPSPVQRSRSPFVQRIRRILKDGKAELIAGPRLVQTSLLSIRNPSVLSNVPPGLPPIEADHVLMIANQVPEDARGSAPYYDPAQVHRNIRATFDHEAVWAPIGPAVREALAPHDVPMNEVNWENIIDLDSWARDRTTFVSDRPVIGRHSRGHWSKWPATREDLLAAYPSDERYKVRVMGGTEAPEAILGTLPANWTTLPFDALPVRDFLAGIDFFVYFHHPGLVEAFGRVVLEALATGAVCVAPRELEPIFGDACYYGTPQQVRPFVDDLYNNPEEFTRWSERGLNLVRERFSYKAHIERTAALIGPSNGEGRQAHPELSTTSPAVVLAPDLDLNDGHVLQEIAGSSTHLVVLTDAAGPSGSERVGNGNGRVLVETVPATLSGESRQARDADLRRRLAHLARAHRTKRVVLLEPDAVRHTTDVDDEVQVQVFTRTSTGEHAPAEATTTEADRRRSPRVLARRWSRKAVSLARQRGPQWIRRGGRAVADTASRIRRGATGFAEATNSTLVPVPPIYSHLHPRSPVVLLVVTSEEVEAAPTLDSVLARAQVASSFRFAVLAPRSWIAEAAARGVTLETWVPQTAWWSTYTAQWPEYARERLTEVSRWIRPAAVVNIDRTIDPGADPTSGRVLDLIEASARARH